MFVSRSVQSSKGVRRRCPQKVMPFFRVSHIRTMLARPRSVLRCVPLPFLARGVRTRSTAAALCAVGVVNLKKSVSVCRSRTRTAARGRVQQRHKRTHTARVCVRWCCRLFPSLCGVVGGVFLCAFLCSGDNIGGIFIAVRGGVPYRHANCTDWQSFAHNGGGVFPRPFVL